MRALKVAAVILAGVVGSYYFAFGTFYVCGYRVYRVPTVGMQPTIQKGESVIGRLSSTYQDRVQRFDLAIISPPISPGQLIVKRVVGLPGEHITIDESGVKIDGRELSLPNNVQHAGLASKRCDILIPNDNIFVLGDFTSDSFDSRSFGPISKNSVKGYLVFKK